MSARTVQILITGNADQAVREIEKLTGAVETSSRTMHDRISAVGGMALVGIGAGLVAVGAASVKMADDFEVSHTRLTNALKNVGISFAQAEPAIDATNQKFESLGFTNAQTEDAMSRAVVATKNVTTAQKEVAVAADLARARHMDLNSALQLVIRAGSGTYTSLLRLGIVTKDQAKSFKDGADAVDFLGQKFSGQAAGYADTFGGKIAVLKAQLTDLGVKIGNVLIPIIEDLASAISSVIDWFERHKEAAIVLAGVITTVLGAAISVFVYDKISAFVSGIQRMLTGLGLLKAQAEETAATVEASGATMAESSAAGGAAVGGEAAAGVGAAGAEAGGGLEAASTGAAASLGEFTLLIGAAAGVAYGLSQVFGESENTRISFRGLATADVPQLTQSLESNRGKIDQLNGALDGYGIHVTNASVNHREFNKILQESPQYAQSFIDAVQKSGGNTEWFTARLEDHTAAAERAKVAQERYALQLEIADAKARGDGNAVYMLTAELNNLPTDKAIDVSVYGNAQQETAAILGNLYDIASHSVVDVTINTIHQEFNR